MGPYITGGVNWDQSAPLGFLLLSNTLCAGWPRKGRFLTTEFIVESRAEYRAGGDSAEFGALKVLIKCS